MPLAAVDWSTVSSLATGFGTLVLAIATFGAVRSANRSARIAEMALQEQRRPLLASSRFDDPRQKIMFGEGRWVAADGGRAGVEVDGGVVFLVLSLRNIGSGIAVCQGWAARPAEQLPRARLDHLPLDQLRLQQRDLYIAPGDIGMWQGALRDPEDPWRTAVAEAVGAGRPITVEVLYSDQAGGQRTISRFSLQQAGGMWMTNLNRHWHLDWQGPRPQHLVEAAFADTRNFLRADAAAPGAPTPAAPPSGASAAGSPDGDAEGRAWGGDDPVPGERIRPAGPLGGGGGDERPGAREPSQA